MKGLSDNLERKYLFKVNNLDEATPRSSHQRCHIQKDFPKNFAKFAGKHHYWSPFFNKEI